MKQQAPAAIPSPRHLGGSVHRREAGRYEITRVPGPIRAREPRAGCAGPVLERYERICFEKSRIDGPGSDPGSGSDMGASLGSGAGPDSSSNLDPGPSADPGPGFGPNPGTGASLGFGSDLGSGSNPSPGPPAAVCLSPGHPLLDATVDLVLERYRGVLAEGAVLVDESDEAGEGEAIRALFHFEIAVRDGQEHRPGHPRIVSRQLRFVEVDADADAAVDTEAGPSVRSVPSARSTPSVRDAGPAPYLDYRPIEDDERASIAVRLEAVRPVRSGQPVWPDRPDQPGRGLEDMAMIYARTHLASNQAGEIRPFRAEPDFDAVSVTYNLRELLARAEAPR